MLAVNSTLPKSPTNQSPPKNKGHKFTPETSAKARAQSLAVRRTKAIANPISAHDAEYYGFKRTFTGNVQSMIARCVLHFNSSRTRNGDGVVISNIEKLFRIWCHLTGTPAPGNLRPQDLVKRVEKLGLKSFAQQVMIDAPSPVEELMSEPTPEQTTTTNEQPTEPTPETEAPTDDALSDNLDVKESLNFPQAEPVPTPDPTHPADEG